MMEEENNSEVQGRDVLEGLYAAGLDDVNGKKGKKEGKKRYTKIEETIFIIIWDNPEMTYQALGLKYNISGNTIRQNAHRIWSDIGELMGGKCVNRRNLKKSVFCFFNPTPNVEQMKGALIQEQSIRENYNNYSQNLNHKMVCPPSNIIIDYEYDN